MILLRTAPLLIINIALSALFVEPFQPALAQALTTYEIHNPSGAVRRLLGQKRYRRALAVSEAAVAKYIGPHPDKIGVDDWRANPTGQELAFRELNVEQLRNLFLGDLYNLQAVAYNNMGQSTDSEKCLRKALAANPQHAIAAANLGAIFVKRGNAKEALVVLDQAIRANQRAETAYQYRAMAHRMLNQFDKERKDTESFKYWTKHNRADNINMSYLSRFDYIGKVLENKPPTARNRLALAMVRKEQSRWNESEQCFQSAIKLEPKMPEAHWAYGLLLIEQDKFSAAIVEIGRAIAIEPTTENFYYSRAAAFAGAHKYAEAIADFNKVIEMNKRPALLVACYLGRGRCHAGLKENALAIKDFDKAMTLNPDQEKKVLIYCARGDAQRELGSKQLAVKEYDQALAIEPENKHAFEQRGKLMLSMGEFEQATVDLSTSKNVGTEATSHAPPSQDDIKAQIAHYDRLIKTFPNAIDSLYSQGLLYLTLGDAAKAAADMQAVLQKAKELNDTTDSAACFCTIALHMQKRDAEAAKLGSDYRKRRGAAISSEMKVFLIDYNERKTTTVQISDFKRRTRFLTMVGIEQYVRGRLDASRRTLTAVRNLEQTSMDEYEMAITYLQKLGKN